MSRWPLYAFASLSVAALLMAAAALYWAVFHDPLGPGLKKYDFSHAPSRLGFIIQDEARQ